jgi:transposase InsO family protein
MAHANARLNVRGRLLIIERLASGMTQAQVAEMQGVSRATVGKWARRFRQLPAGRQAEVVRLRSELGVGPHQIAARTGLPCSTVYRTLRRAGLSRLAHLDRTTRVVIRYEKDEPGRLVHLDVKKVRRIPDGGGRRKDPEWYITNTSYRIRGPRRGQDFIHVAVDDHSRFAYAEALPDEKAETTVGFLERAVQAMAKAGITVSHVISDNGPNYTSRLFQQAAAGMGICLHRTRPYRPQTNGKAEAFIKTLKREWIYKRIYLSNQERLEELPEFLCYYNHHRPHTSLGLLPPISRLSTTSW